MDIIEYMEMVSGTKLLDYQKKFIRYVEEHPDCKMAIGRGSTRNHDLLMLYFTCKSILLKED